MSSLFEQLPPELYKSLNRWYLVSTLACCATLLFISYIHISTALTLNRSAQAHPDLIQTPVEQISTEEEAKLIESENKLKSLTAEHVLFFKLFGAILSSVPQQIQLTHFVIEPQTISCKGLANSMDDITLFMRTLQEKIHLSITGLDIQESSQSLLSFSLSASVKTL